MDSLTPIIKWADTKSKLFLTIELSDVKEPEIKIETNSFSFQGYGIGARGENFYEASLNFYGDIDPTNVKQKITDRCISFTFTKKEEENWLRLLKEKSKSGWLKIDFDKMATEDSEKEDVQQQLNSISIENKMKSELDRANDKIAVFIKIAYLTIYNVGQGVAFWVIVLKLFFGLLKKQQDGFFTAYDDVSDLLMTCQLCAFIEIINPILGIVKTGIIAPLIQVGGRNFILFFLIMPNIELHSSSIVFVLFMAWSLIETIRYPFYVLSLFRRKFYLLAWLRYSVWVVLYPLGLICEGLIVYKSIPLAEKSGRLSIALPNAFNCSFSFAFFLRSYIICLLIGGSYMMKHLLILRNKKLGYNKRKKSALKKD